ncbi:GNAT family N-acetyltransferase, partial [Salmonella enterica subsp. enterica serovar Kentucky]
MIRKSQSEDMASILALWMQSTIYAHPFIEERYWHESEAIVRDVYLP